MTGEVFDERGTIHICPRCDQPITDEQARVYVPDGLIHVPCMHGGEVA
jgi:hypothetical protein